MSLPLLRLIEASVGGKHDANLEIGLGDKLRQANLSKLKSTKDSRIDYLSKELPKYTQWFFYIDGKCGAYVETEVVSETYRSDLEKILKTKKLLVPHASATLLKGLGYPTFVYTQALNKGFCLVTQEHTKEASLLWDSVSRKTGSTIIYVNTHTQQISKTPLKSDAFKVMIPKGSKVAE